MKTNQILLILVFVLLICLFTITPLNALDIYGVYVIDEDYVLNDHLYIHPGGSIMNEDWNDYVTLTVFGNIINEGTITDNNAGGSLTIRVNGNVTNGGTWDCIATYLIGSAQQNISCLNANSFESPTFYNNNSTTIIANNDLYFSGVNIHWQNNGSLDLSAGHTLYIDGGQLYQADVIGGTGSALNMSGSADLHHVTIDNVILSGTVNIYVGVTFTGDITNTEILQNKSGGYYTLLVNGNFINEGTVTNNSTGSLTVRANANVTNDGTWDCSYTYLDGSADQHVSCLNMHSFQSLNFYCNSSGGNIYFDTDIEFAETNIDLTENNLILQTGNTLTLTGGNLRNGTVTANNAVLNMTDDAYLYNVEIENADLQGICQVYSNEVVFSGTTTVNGTLRNKYYYDGYRYTLTLNGDIINNGTISNNGGNSLYIDIPVDIQIINNGIWQNDKIELTGTTDQHFSNSGVNPLEISWFSGNSSLGNIYFDTDIEFAETNIDLTENNLILQTGNTLTLTGGNLRNGTVTVNNAVLNMTDDAYLYNVEIENADLQGICQVYSNEVVFNGTTTVNGTLRNKYDYGQSYTLTLNGDIINNGTISNNGGSSLYIDIPLDIQITDNGIWQNYDIELTGTTDQHFSCSGDITFALSSFSGNSSVGNIYFDTEVEFVGTTLDLNGNNLILQTGNMLTLTGGQLLDGTVTANNTVLNMTDDAFLRDVEIENAELQGICQISGNNVICSGTTTVTGILQNKHSYQSLYTLTVSGDLINNGTIRNGSTSSYLAIDFLGDIVNNGIWQNSNIEPIGISNQSISSTFGNTFAISHFYGNSFGGDVTFTSDVEFAETIIDLTDDNLFLQEGNTLTLTGGRLQNGMVTANNAALNMSGDADLYDVEIENAELQGICQISGNNVICSGTTTVTGILQNKHSYQSLYTLTVSGNLINNGTIRNSHYSSYFGLLISDNITNNGSWSNYITSLNGTTDQTIFLENSNYITGDVRFVSDITGSSYQWNFNSVSINSPDFTGETSVELDWNVPVSGDYTGTYNCDVISRNLSRNIIVTEPALQNADFVANITTGNVPLTINFTDLSTGNPTNWEWDFDNDGSVDSNEQNPIHIFTEAGIYTVSLNVSDGTNSDTETKIDYITVNEVVFTLELPDSIYFPEDGYTSLDLAEYITYSNIEELTITYTGNNEVEISNEGLVLQLSASANWFGEELVYINVDNNISRTVVIDSMLIIVEPVNDAPEMTLPEIMYLNGLGELSMNLADYTFDVDNDNLLYTAIAGEELEVEITGSMVNITAEISWLGSENIVFCADDQQGRVTVCDTVLVIREFSPYPVIEDIIDVPDDQGGWVIVEFSKSCFDTDSLIVRPVEQYVVQYLIDDDWIIANSTTAFGAEVYQILAHTFQDSMPGNPNIYEFRVIAGMEEGNFVSNIMSGYSLDNICPAVPSELLFDSGYLVWNEPVDEDFAYFSIYKDGDLLDYSTVPGMNIIGDSGDYEVAAIDCHGNESELSTAISGGYPYGDVDHNIEVEAMDASLILQHFCLIITDWQDWQIAVADVDGNGSVEAYDAALILRYTVGIIDEFPVETITRQHQEK